MIPPFSNVLTIEALRADIDELGRLGVTDAYRTKQLHRIPVAPVVDRVPYILEQCRDKDVLHLGCSWPVSALHTALSGRHCASLYGVDITVPPELHGRGYWRIDLDTDQEAIPVMQWGVILVAEVLEHLGNPGRLLQVLKQKHCTRWTQILITVPNAYARAGRYAVSGGIENVNRQHVAYYSYWTLRELVTRYGYEIEDFCWYNQPRNGQPQESEGLIMLVR